MPLIYPIISFIASIAGAISGIGGGVIIKPTLDVATSDPVDLIGFLSGSTVLAMTTVALFRSRKSTVRLDKRISSLLALGGVLGGLSGKILFDLIERSIKKESTLSGTQSIILLILTLAVLLFTLNKNRITPLNLNGSLQSLFTGLLLGGIASFLGIGGGPVNLALLYFFFSMDSKTGALNSIFIIFCSQLTNLVFTVLSGEVPPFHGPVLALMITGGITGGLAGTCISGKLSNRQVDYLFSAVMVVIMGITIFNILESFVLPA